MLEALFYHFHQWVLALSDISNQVFSLYPYANAMQTGFKTGQTPKSRKVCQAESVRQFFPRRRSVVQLPTADSASKYLLSDPSSLLLQQSNLASEYCSLPRLPALSPLSLSVKCSYGIIIGNRNDYHRERKPEMVRLISGVGSPLGAEYGAFDHSRRPGRGSYCL